VLELSRVSRVFGGLVAVKDLDLTLDQGELLGLIGPNGAGKSTVFNVISGVFPPSAGDVIFKARSVGGWPPHRIARMGLARTFQIGTLFSHLTVLQNVMIGGYQRAGLGIGFVDTFLPQRRKRAELERLALETVELVGLRDFRDARVASLPHGRQQAVALAIALATKPAVLMLDEPLGGMDAEETTWFMELIDTLRRNGRRSILLVEHNVKAVMNYCDRICVLNFGSKIADGTPGDIKENDEVIKAYLGVEGYAPRG
jgi:branched-chain amino acid transport system ATP-binding protein